jgi:hypothetical protein
MAALALPSLVPADQQLSVCLELVQSMHAHDTNTIHGQLCQIQKLLNQYSKTNIADATSPKTNAPTELVQIFTALLPILHHPCGPVQLVALRIFRETLFSCEWFGSISSPGKRQNKWNKLITKFIKTPSWIQFVNNALPVHGLG